MAKQKGNSSLPKVIYHSRFGDVPLAPRKIVRVLPPFLVQDPTLVARNRAFERALRRIGAIRKPRPPVGIATAAPVLKPAAAPTIEEAENARTDCAQAPGPVTEPNEGAERQGTEPVEDAAGQALEEMPPVYEGHKRQPQRRRRKKVLRDPAMQLLQKLLDRGLLQVNMKKIEVYQVFFKSWSENKRKISDTTVGRAWDKLLKKLRVNLE
jgi:hypothetical protein